MKQYFAILLVAMILLIPTACSKTIDEEESKPFDSVKVEVKPVQTVLLSQRAILIDAQVTEGANGVRDTDEVKFEIWKKDSDKHELIVASHWLEGTYRIQTMFPDGGVYYVRAQVKNNDVKVMSPDKELIVEENMVRFN
jgi:hypothetical protein